MNHMQEMYLGNACKLSTVLYQYSHGNEGIGSSNAILI